VFKNKIKVLFTMVIVVIVLFIMVMDVPVNEINYTKTMDATMYLMVDGSEQLNGICIQNYDLWCDAAYTISDTYPYNKRSDSFSHVVGINYILHNKDGLPSELYIKLQDNIKSVEKNITKLSSHKAYDIGKYDVMMQTYNNYEKMINLAVNPSGTVSEYGNNFVQVYSKSDSLEKLYKNYWNQIAFLIINNISISIINTPYH